jgi:hypothetical protein
LGESSVIVESGLLYSRSRSCYNRAETGVVLIVFYYTWYAGIFQDLKNKLQDLVAQNKTVRLIKSMMDPITSIKQTELTNLGF